MSPRNFFILTFFAILVGPLAATSSHLFLGTLALAGEWRSSYPLLVWTLPLTGLLMTLIYKKLPSSFNTGVSQLLLELRSPDKKANPLLSLWIFIAASLAHLGGASVGREGVGLLMSGSLVDGIFPFKENSKERSILLQAALSAGFTGMFGTPLAGILFIFEINQFKGTSPVRCLAILLAVTSTYWCGNYLGTPHSHFSPFETASWNGIVLMFIGIPISAYFFYYSYQFIHHQSKRLGQLKLFWGGMIIALISSLFGLRYSGLGLSTINEAIQGLPVFHWDWMAKLLLTSMAIGFGFKGGEVTPLFFIGATLGASLGSMTGDPELAKLGMVSVLGALTHTPLAAGILSYELFGWRAVLWVTLLSAWGKFLLRGRHLYRFN